MKNFLIFLITSSLFIQGWKCSSNKADEVLLPEAITSYVKEKNPNSVKLNISLLLDLSDRIQPSKHPGFVQKDLEYISSITKAFQGHCLNKRLPLMDERMQVYFNPTPGNNQINNMAAQLKSSIDKNITKTKLLRLSFYYDSIIKKIYNQAVNDSSWVGSDTWDFFKTKIGDYNLIKEGYKNILILLTDGYMLYLPSRKCVGTNCNWISSKKIKQMNLNTSDWENVYTKKQLSFIPANTNLNNLKVLVIGINPEPGNVYEKEVLHKYWEDWFISMGVKKNMFKVLGSDLPSNYDETIQNFILEN